jgi:hypothetical protein
VFVALPPDGHTLTVTASGHATNPFLNPKIPQDTPRYPKIPSRIYADIVTRILCEHFAGSAYLLSQKGPDYPDAIQGDLSGQ